MAASITFDFISRGGPALARDFKSAGDNAAAAARGAKVLQTTIEQLGKKENRTAEESVLLAKALRLTGDAEDRAAAKALAADIAIRRLGDAMQDTSKSTDSVRGGFAGLVGEVTGFGAASTAASAKSTLFARALAGINLASGVLEPALAGAVVAAGGLAAAFAAAGAGAAAYSAALKPLLSQTTDVMKAQETLDKARATAQANYAAAIKSGASAKTADAARTKAMTAAQDQYNIAVKGTPGPVREFAKSVTAAKTTYTGVGGFPRPARARPPVDGPEAGQAGADGDHAAGAGRGRGVRDAGHRTVREGQRGRPDLRREHAAAARAGPRSSTSGTRRGTSPPGSGASSRRSCRYPGRSPAGSSS